MAEEPAAAAAKPSKKRASRSYADHNASVSGTCVKRQCVQDFCRGVLSASASVSGDGAIDEGVRTDRTPRQNTHARACVRARLSLLRTFMLTCRLLCVLLRCGTWQVVGVDEGCFPVIQHACGSF